MDESFDEYYLPLSNNNNHPALIQKWKKNIDAAAYEKIKPRNKATIKEEINWSSWYHESLAKNHKRSYQLVFFSEYHVVYCR